MKMEHVVDPNAVLPTSPSFPHGFSGNPGGIRTGPPIRTFGGDGFGVASLRPNQIFEGGHEVNEERKLNRRRNRFSNRNIGILRVLRDLRGWRVIRQSFGVTA